jgi:CRP-like cAMP-binding protein
MNPANLFKHEPDPIQLAAGEILFREGELGDCMYVLLEGKMNVLVAGEVVEQSEPGALLGEMALIDDSPRVATVVASDASRLAKVDQRRFNLIIQQNPFFAKHVMRELVERLRRMNRVHAAAATRPDAALKASPEP